ncbi:MAG: MBL fold metallo-hydrolase [Proteobacteria bacterium]|nr:MAG: MBL fold metallo-hydrolase [Pseudomonadota bacterium]
MSSRIRAASKVWLLPKSVRNVSRRFARGFPLSVTGVPKFMNDLEVEILNGLQGDPAVYAFIRTSGEALLFDLGMIDQLSQRDLMKVRHVFVSHTHMDHFMGFDRWLRVNIPHKRLLKIWGPAPFFERVQARLRSYSWNLIAPDQLRFEVHEVRPDGTVATALITNTDFFAIHEQADVDSIDQLTVLADGSILSTVALDHNNIVSLAYKFRSPDKLKFLHDELPALGLTSGSWIGQLQYKVKHDRARAVAKAHLTTRQAALIAMTLSVEDFKIFHVSTIYGQGAEASLAEAQSFFEELTGLDGKDQEQALEAEFLVVEELKAKA